MSESRMKTYIEALLEKISEEPVDIASVELRTTDAGDIVDVHVEAMKDSRVLSITISLAADAIPQSLTVGWL